MKYNFCTLFDTYYLTRGLALYKSLEKYCDNFHLYIYAFDDRSNEILLNQNLRHATIIPLHEFETEELLKVKPYRTIAEYCWTSTASIIWHSIIKYNLDHCTYLDADIAFFSSPESIFIEIGSSSVAITPHYFSPSLKSSEIYGKYCVQFTYFKNDSDGINALNWWRTSCIDWCYAKLEDGRYGDQKYLDSFPDMFNNVHIISDIGSGVAPWNVANYNYFNIDGNILLSQKNNMSESYSPLIFYHFQGLKFLEKKENIIAQAAIVHVPKIIKINIYIPYIENLIYLRNLIENRSSNNSKIIFKRPVSVKVKTFISLKFKNNKLLMRLLYLFKRQNYSRPSKIGTNIT